MKGATNGNEVGRLAEFLNAEVEQPADKDKAAISEAKKVLRTLITPGATQTVVRAALARLLKQINAIGLTPEWLASRVKPQRAILRLSHTGWILTPRFHDLKEPAEKLYSVILRSCADGSLSQLRQCKGCMRAFVIDYKTQKFCMPACTAAFYDGDALARVRKSRKSKSKKMKKLAEQNQQLAESKRRHAEKAVAIKAFEIFLVKSTRQHPEEDPGWASHFIKIPESTNSARWKVINEWAAAKRSGEAIGAIWRRVPKTFRDSLNP